MNQDNKSDSLTQQYQQRKTKHKMPTNLVENIQLAARQVHKKPSLLRSANLWGPTIAACFVLLMSYQLMPQFYSSDEITPSYAQPLPPTKVQTPVETELHLTSQLSAPAIDDAQAQSIATQATQAQIDAVAIRKKVKSTQAQERSIKLRENVTAANIQISKTKPAIADQFATQASNIHADVELLAVSGAKMEIETVKIVQLQVQVEQQDWQLAIDCELQSIKIANHWLNGLTQTRWVEVTLNSAEEVIALTALPNYQGCNHNE